MEIGNEISQKIRGAIKAKLVDLGSYVDDELPDYIMVMVANKKTKAQMADDLNLFLGANTDLFTSWLHDVLSKLETATVTPSGPTEAAQPPPKPSPEKPPSLSPAKTSPEKPAAEPTTSAPKKSKKSKRNKDKSSHHKSSKHKKGRKSSDTDKAAVTATSVTADKPQESAAPALSSAEAILEAASQETILVATEGASQETLADAIISLNPDTHDIFDEEIYQESKKQDEKVGVRKSSQTKTASKTRSVSASNIKASPGKSTVVASSQAASKSPATSPTSGQMPTKRTVEKTTVTRVRSSSTGATLSTITVVPPKPDRKRRGPGSVVGQVIHKDDDDDDDDGQSRKKKVASTVELHRRPSLPVSKQANTSLLKKAVSAAQESTKDAIVTADITRSMPTVVQGRPQPAQRRFQLIRATSASGANKTLLVRAVNAANESTVSSVRSPPAMTNVAPATVRGHQQQSPPGVTAAMYSRTTAVKTEVPRTGLVSRSRLREVAERDFDTQEFMTIETTEDIPQTMQIEEYYAESEEQEEEMEAVDSRHIFVEDLTKRGRPANVMGRAVEVMGQEEHSGDIMMVVESAKPVADTHVVVKKEKPTPPRPVSPKFIVTLDGPPSKPGKSKKPNPKTKAAAFIAPRMDITRTIDNSSMSVIHPPPLPPQFETDFIQTAVTSYQEEYFPAAEPEFVYVSSQMSPPAQAVFSPTSMTMMADMEQVAVSGQMQFEEQGVVLDQQQLESAPNKKQSQSERCRFWPACKNGNDCPFVHPTAPCKTFPNCKFGDKCVFIHPNCKWDARCTKTNCPFTHASKRSPSAPAPRPPPPRPKPRLPPPSRGPSQPVCKFFPNCANMDCPFLHPKPCRFGRSCSRKDCRFQHPQVVRGAALKWTKGTKEGKHISERSFAVKTSEQQILPS